MIYFPKEPYDFFVTTKIISSTVPQVFNYVIDNKFRRVLRNNNQLYLMEAEYLFENDKPKISIKCLSHDNNVSDDLYKKMKWILACEIDITDFYKLLDTNIVMKSIKNLLYGMRILNGASFYEGLFEAIIEQQISKKGSMVTRKKIADKLCDYIVFEDKKYYEFPRAEIVSQLCENELIAFGLNRNKCSAIKNIANLEIRGTLTELLYKSIDDIMSELLKIKGIGIWTIQYAIIRSIGMYDYSLHNDHALLSGYRKLFGDTYFKTDEEFYKFLNRFTGYQAYASFYIIYASAFQKN
jgi:DNA-3-methyladenine glycosylase II